jgi:hypothetical protein
MSGNIYNINWNSLTALLLPTFLRGPKMLAWLNSLVYPIQLLHAQFLEYRLDAIYRIEHTPQVYAIEKVLNEEFDDVLHRIYIEDGEYTEQLYFFTPDEELPVYIFGPNENNPVYFFGENDAANTSVDFIVHLPLSYQGFFEIGSNNRNKLDSLINYYRLPDKTYQIIYV